MLGSAAPEVLTIKMPAHLSRRLALAAKAQRVPKSALARAYIEAKLAEAPQPTNLYAKIAHLAGSGGVLPKDLSTNPKYLKGFGE